MRLPACSVGFFSSEYVFIFLDLLPLNGCFQVYCHLFTGPTSALGQTEHGQNKNKARIFELKAVTGRTIAYACVQVSGSLIFRVSLSHDLKTYIALSNMKRWGSSNGLFYLDEFYDNIVSIFEDNADSPWVEETLEWWNK